MAGSLNMTTIAQGEALSRRPTPTGLASASSAFVEAFTVVRARSHTMLTATTPSTVWAGWKRECFTASSTAVTSSEDSDAPARLGQRLTDPL